ncbi:hypothetical protein GCM10022198_15420 [Klugiella xanthotipulae]|uniref:Uncharacterized protein n=1 Tax=Klugiella xanthotipulae TaxID=244735 RepID=A0A543HGY0_9MICO|nr:hypothetical protein [Klugiella xanthotipulae]TQM57580.1 hypothetical protein FB466_2573 [Klugiella xanthotipulae]
MGYYEELLYRSAYRAKIDSTDFQKIQRAADSASLALKKVAGTPGWDGKSADAAVSIFDTTGKKMAESADYLNEIKRIIDGANRLIDYARDAYEEIQNIGLTSVEKAAIVAGGTLLVPGVGTILSTAGIATAEAALGCPREEKSKAALEALSEESQTLAHSVENNVKNIWKWAPGQDPVTDVPRHEYPPPTERGTTGDPGPVGGTGSTDGVGGIGAGPVFPGPGSTVPGPITGITDPGPGGGGTGPGGSGPGGGGGGGGTGVPVVSTLPGDGIVWDPESPYYPGDTSADDGSGSGGGTTGGLGNGTGGVLGGIAGAGVAVGAAKLSTGGLGGGGVVLGGGNTPGGTGLKPAPASTTPTGAGGARGGMGMMGGAPAGSGSGEKKRPTTRGLIAPRLEDDEPFVQPKAGAGSRVPGDPLYEAAQAQRRAEEERNKPTPKKRWWHH